MLIGCCGNCKYTDLLQDILDTCPRCGARMVSLGIESFDWNDLDTEGRQSIIDATFPPDSPEGAEPPIPDTFWELYPKREPKIKIEPDPELSTETVNTIEEPEIKPEADPDKAPEIDPEADPEPEIKPSIIAEMTEPETEIKPEPVKDPEPEIRPEDETVDHTGYSGYVYVCYRCNSISGQGGICPECGSDMIKVGYTAKEWAFLSKEEKRQAAEDARYAILSAPFRRRPLKIRNTNQPRA